MSETNQTEVTAAMLEVLLNLQDAVAAGGVTSTGVPWKKTGDNVFSLPFRGNRYILDGTGPKWTIRREGNAGEVSHD